jgi:hypothetical protein
VAQLVLIRELDTRVHICAWRDGRDASGEGSAMLSIVSLETLRAAFLVQFWGIGGGN